MSAPSVQFRILPGGHNIALEGGGSFPTPHDEPESSDKSSLEWRLRYANTQQLVADRFIAAEIVSAYRYLLTCSEKRRKQVVRAMREAMRSGAS